MSNKITRQAFREHIREIILDEAKKTKKKSKDVAPQEDVDINFNMDDEQSSNDTQPSNDTVAPETGEMGDINPTVKSIQDSLQKAYAQAKQLGDAKLATQIGNTLTMLLRDQVLGQQSVNEGITAYSFVEGLVSSMQKYLPKDRWTVSYEFGNIVVKNDFEETATFKMEEFESNEGKFRSPNFPTKGSVDEY